ncbi:MAG: hypothetical protein E6R13_04840 [Spirochaetes bacterium]|nr:MAG: hypothetical protein E6R13_04840 [Spirochaetota bacterium]
MPFLKVQDTIAITSSGGSFSLDVNASTEIYNITGAATMISNVTIAPLGTPVLGLTYVFNYKAVLDITTNSTSITIFGQTLTAAQALNSQVIECSYNGTSWDVDIQSSFDNSNIVSTSNIQNNAITSSKIAAGAISTSSLADDSISTVKLQDDAVTTSKIDDDAVTNDKLNTMTASSVKIGNASGTPTDLALGNGKIPMGNGTSITAVDKGATLVDSYDTLETIVSFEAGEVTAILELYLPYNCTIYKIKASVIKAIAGTDDGTITIVDNFLTTTIATMTIPASSALSTYVTATPNYAYEDISGINAGKISLTTNKTTPGGKVAITIITKRT